MTLNKRFWSEAAISSADSNTNTNPSEHESDEPVQLADVMCTRPIIKETERGLLLQKAILPLHANAMFRKYVSLDGAFVQDFLNFDYILPTNKSKFNSALELAFYVATSEEIKDLSDENTPEERLNVVAKSIEARALVKMRHLNFDFKISKLLNVEDAHEITELKEKRLCS